MLDPQDEEEEEEALQAAWAVLPVVEQQDVLQQNREGAVSLYSGCHILTCWRPEPAHSWPLLGCRGTTLASDSGACSVCKPTLIQTGSLPPLICHGSAVGR
jgi:hypothetical protein